MKAFSRRLRKRAHEFTCRVQNFWYWRGQGLDVRHAWKKADLTL